MQVSIDNKVGGYFGVGMTQSKTEFKIDNARYAPGDQICIDVNANNTACNNSIKNFKFKIYRKV